MSTLLLFLINLSFFYTEKQLEVSFYNHAMTGKTARQKPNSGVLDLNQPSEVYWASAHHCATAALLLLF